MQVRSARPAPAAAICHAGGLQPAAGKGRVRLLGLTAEHAFVLRRVRTAAERSLLVAASGRGRSAAHGAQAVGGAAGCVVPGWQRLKLLGDARLRRRLRFDTDRVWTLTIYQSQVRPAHML